MFLFALLFSTAQAVVPIAAQFPECGIPYRPDLCPADLDEEWWLIGYTPSQSVDSVRASELDLGSGVGADLAWRVTTGHWDALIAVGDSGIEWHNRHLVNKVHLNTLELPPPVCEDGEEAEDHDCDGNGLTNIQDYAFDERVDWNAGRDAADGMLDPSDLIYTEWGADWDGVDNDGNGYVDDIAGWDFFAQDNDPWNDFDTGYGTHGSGVMEDAAGEGQPIDGEDDGQIGVCPNCAILPIRVGDTFVVDGTRAGQAIAFATDHGAVVISLAVGALSNPGATTQAAAYAYNNGTLIVGAAGDENAYHHNFPAVLDNAVYVHSIRHDTSDSSSPAYSYMNTWNCNNYGARMTLVAASPACATGAVAVTGGVVGLIHSAAWEQGLELSSGEVYQLLHQSATDVWLSEEELKISRAYPSKKGWDAFHGYGRANAGAAVQMVAEGKIPPAVSIDTPSWFAPLDLGVSPVVEVRGRMSARTHGFKYILEVGFGHEPSRWEEVFSGSGTGAFDGVIAKLDLSDHDFSEIGEATQFEGILERLERVNQRAFTLRLQVTDDSGLMGEMRKTAFMDGDASTLPGFPIDMGTSGESSPVLADMDGDGVFEILIATADGTVLALHGDGTPVDGWPVGVDPVDGLHPDATAFASGAVDMPNGDAFIATVAVGDIDGDDLPEVVAASGRGGMYAWEMDGSRVSGFPAWAIGREPDEFDRNHTYDQGFAGAPALVDLDGDGALEIVDSGLDGRLYVFDGSGEDWGPYPVELCYPGTVLWDYDDLMCGVHGHRSITSPTVGDFDGDGDIEIGLGTNEPVNDGQYVASYLFDATSGTHADGWPRQDVGLINESALLPLVGQGHPSSMATADLDGDGDLEIINPVMLGQTDIMGHDGTVHMELSYVASDWGEGHNVNVPSIVQMVNNPALGDLDGDGIADPVMGGAGAMWIASLGMISHFEFQHGVAAWSGATGEVLPGWPRQIEDIQFLVAPAIADVSGDGKPEVIYGSGGYLLYAWDGEGNLAEGWPHFTGGWILGSPAVGDITGDGYVDVVVSTREGHLLAWSTQGHADQDIQWASIHHDSQNTGNYHTPLPTQAGPPPVADHGEDSKGCGCGAAPRRPVGLVWLALLLPLLIRRQS